MTQQTQDSQQDTPTISLPGDEEVKLSILLTAGHFVKDALYAPTIYRNEAQAQEITGLTALSRDVDDGANRRLVARKRLAKTLGDTEIEHKYLPKKSSLIMPLVLILGTGFFGAVVYAQYYPSVRDQILGGLTLNAPYIAVFAFFILVIALWWTFARRRQRNKVSE